MKVFELADDIGVEYKEVISALKEKGITVSSHLNKVEESVAKEIREEMSVKVEAETPNDEVAELKRQLAELQSQLDTKKDFDDEPDFDDVPEISMGKTIKVMSLLNGGLNLKTSNDSSAQVFRFTMVGQIFPIMYSDLVKIIANQRKFFENGSCMVLDDDVVRAHYLQEHTAKFVSGKVINNILEYSADKIRSIFEGTTPVIKQSIIDTVIAKINGADNIDKNKVSAISDLYGSDLFELASKLK